MKITTYVRALSESSKRKSIIDPQQAYALADQARTLAHKHKLYQEEGYALFHMAYACRVMSDYANGLTLSFKAWDIFESIKDSVGLYRIRNIIGIIYFYYGAYADALEHFQQGLALLETYKDPNVKSSILNNIGEIYREAGDFEKAQTYYEAALEIATRHNFEFNKAAIWLNMSEINHQLGHYEQALSNAQKAYEIVVRDHHILEQGEAESKLARTLLVLGAYDEARVYAVSALEKFEKMNNKYYLVDLLIEMTALDEVNKISPVSRFMEALEIATQSNLGKKEGLIYKRLSEYYERQFAFDKALEYFKKYHFKMTEIETLDLSKRLEILSVEFDYYKQKKEQNQYERLAEKLSREVMTTKNELEAIKENNQNLFEKSIMDELTQVYNRRGIDHQLKKWFSQNQTFEGAVYLIDMDAFKKYNDHWGHVRGDHCLMQVAAALSDLPFENYFVGRYGGDEFIAFAMVTDYDQAVRLGERIHRSIEMVGDMDDVTLSVGGFFGLLSEEKIEEIIEIADAQLYTAKDLGKNRFMMVQI